jgi:hypothetical protein
VSLHLVLHALAVKKHADAPVLAEFTGLSQADVARLLGEAAGSGRVVAAQGKYVLAPLARLALDGHYAREYANVRATATFVQAYENFEQINVQLKTLITDWQTIEVGGARVANDHSDASYDIRIVDRLGNLHERADRILAQLVQGLPRLEYYRRKLTEALERAEDGHSEWVSDARLPSYHTLWFELHEDLLRILGRRRAE